MKPEKAADFFIQRAKRSQPNALCVKKSWLRFPEKVAVGSERQSGSFLEQDSTEVPKFAFRSFCPCGNLVGECLPQTLLMRLTPLIPPQPCGSRKEVFTMRKRYNTPHRMPLSCAGQTCPGKTAGQMNMGGFTSTIPSTK